MSIVYEYLSTYIHFYYISSIDANEKNQCDELQKLAKKQMEEWYKADNERIAIAKDINK